VSANLGAIQSSPACGRGKGPVRRSAAKMDGIGEGNVGTELDFPSPTPPPRRRGGGSPSSPAEEAGEDALEFYGLAFAVAGV
jgi:hypothetical protein